MNNDLISRSALILEFCDRPDYSASMFKKIRRRINAAPAVDAVEVVRCQNCKHSGMYCFGTSSEETLACLDVEEDGFIGMATAVKPDFYCADGERRNDET